jgi:hypothetical protein
MNKKLLSLLLFVIAAFTTAFAQETLTVYDGDASNSYVPIYGLYCDSYLKCEYVIPATELQDMTGATITNLTWYLKTVASGDWGAANFQVFLKEVEDATLSAYSGPGTIVYEGALDGTQPEMNIEFDASYVYNGGNLIVGVYNLVKGGWKSAYFYGTTVEGQCVQGYSGTSLEDVTANARAFVPKTCFTYVPAGTVVYNKPINLQVTDITPNSAKLTWEAGGTETSWGVQYKKAADEEWTSAGTVSVKEITLDALANGTAYDVRVKAIYADGESGWLNGTFQTPVCEASDMGEITYELTDTYGDGWNGNKLQIVYNGVVVEELTLTTGGKDEPIVGTVALCYGVDYDLVWVAGSYGYECGFTITGPDGSVIYEFHGTGTSSGGSPTAGVLTTFQINQVTCPRPTNLAASDIVYNGAKLTWTPGNDEQDAWEVVYGAAGFNPDEATPVAVSGEATCNLTDLTENTAYTAYVRGNCGENDKSVWSDPVNFTTPEQFPLPTELTISDITAKSAVGNWVGTAESYNFRYRVKGGVEKFFEESFEGDVAGWSVTGDTWGLMPIANYTMSGTPLFAADGESCLASCSLDGNYAPLDIDNWAITPEIDLKGTLEFYVADLGEGLTENYSVYVKIGDELTALAEGLTTPGAMPASVGAWDKKTFDLSAYEGQTGSIAFRHQHSSDNEEGYYFFLDAVSINGADIPDGEWITMEGVTSPVDIEGLTPNTTYEAQVQAIYGENLSGWTESVDFTTLNNDAIPAYVDVDEITGTTATVYVEGSQDTYNIRYRKVGEINQINEDFETMTTGSNPPEGWTMIDADGDGKCWYGWAPESVTDNSGNPVVNGAAGITSASYQGTALTPDNWLVTPKVNLGGTVSFMYRGQDPSYAAEHFAVYVTTGDDPYYIDSYVQVGEETVAGTTLAEFTADLSEYEGQAGFIAIRHFNCTDMFRLNIDDFVYNHNDLENVVYEWTTVENVEVPYTITGLEMLTDYELQVQGVYESKATTEWTPSVYFTTTDEVVVPEYNEFYVVGTFNDWNQTEEGGRIELVANEEEYEFIGTVELEANAEFKIITPFENGWKWFGGADDNQVGYFLITTSQLDNPIDLMDGSNFRVEEAGEYTITVREKMVPRGVQEPLQMIVTKTQTGISTVGVDYNSNEWYNLNGQKLNGKPTAPGIYINGHKKVIIK